MGILQKFDFRSSSYQRPTQNWVCGRAALGDPCRVGPDGRGVCQATAECQPARDGDRWLCTRPLSIGGACDEGPLPDGSCCRSIPKCSPTRSVRSTRSLVTRWAAVATIGFLAIILGASGSDLVVPGPMTAAHTTVATCSSCHTSFRPGPFGWVHSVFAAAQPVEDSGKCAACHVVDENALRPHGLPEARISEIAARVMEANKGHQQPINTQIRTVLFPVSTKAQNSTPCASCHVEHQGEKFDLTAMSNDRCQACHSVQFSKFSADHPEFSGYPFDRRTRINFDHNSHFSRHFPEQAEKNDPALKPPQTCTNCHQLEGRGELMATKQFANTCASCHTGQITGEQRATGPLGISFLSLPGLDIETLQEKNIGIGEWPEDSEAELTPIMSVLLAAEPGRLEDVKIVRELDLLDLSDATPTQLAAVERVIWSIKSLVFELSISDRKKLQQRFATATGKRPDDILISRLVATMPRDTVLGVRRDWLPNLRQELADRAAGKTVAIPGGKPPAKQAAAAAKPALGPAKQDDILADDKQDILAPAKNDQSEILGDNKDDILSDKKDTSDILSDSKDDILAGSKDDILSESTPGAKDDILGAKDDILSGSKDDILSGSKDEILSGPKDEILAGPKDDILSGDDKAAPPKSAPRSPVATALLEEPEIDEEAFVGLGGWYRQGYQVLYRPTGHADRFFRAWLDYSVSLFGGPGESVVSPVFDAFTSKDAQGQCTKCHSVDIEPGGHRLMKWRPRRVDLHQGGFTRFNHAPHFSAVGERGCTTCHEVDEKADYQSTFKGFDRAKFNSNFSPIKRAVCAECHTESAAGETCLSCHNYHVDEVATPAMETKLPGQVAGGRPAGGGGR